MSADRKSDDLPVFARADQDFCSQIKKMFEDSCREKLKRFSNFTGKAIAAKNEDLGFLSL